MADSDKLALGLDDIIRSSRGSNRRGGKPGFRGRGGVGRGAGQTNGFRTRGGGGGGMPRTSNPPVGRWKHDLYEDNSNGVRGGQRNAGVNSTTKLLISNLDYGVTTNDVQELFEDVGAIRVARVHYDESGRSLGTAEVVFERRADATTALQKYNGLNLDSRPMDIRLVGGVDDGSQQSSNRGSYSNGIGGGNGNQRSGFRNNNQQNGNRGGGNRPRGGRQQQQNGGGSAKKENVTAEDLDAELEAYRAGGAPKK